MQKEGGKGTLQIQITPKYTGYLKQNEFCDVVLHFNSGKSFSAHKIFLAQKSGWFLNYFKKDPSVSSIQIEFDPDGKFFAFITSVYQNHFEIDQINFASFLKCAEYYSFTLEFKQISQYINSLIHRNTILQFSTALSKWDLNTECLQNLSYLYDIFNNTKNKKIFYRSVSPTVFAAILKKLPDSNKIYERFQFISEYVRTNHKALTENDKVQLASVINWKDSKAYRLILEFDNDWIPDSIARNLFSQALNARRKTAKAFENDVQKAKGDNSRWFALSWLHSLSKGIPENATPVVDVFQCARLLGGNNEINPAKYMLFETLSSPFVGQGTNVEYMYSVNNIFTSDNDNYFLSKEGSAKQHPFISFSFGRNAKLLLKSLQVNSYAHRYQPRSLLYQQHSGRDFYIRRGPASLALETGVGGSAPSERVATLDFQDNHSDFTFPQPVLASSIKISMPLQSSAGWWNLRISNIEVQGQFLPN